MILLSLPIPHPSCDPLLSSILVCPVFVLSFFYLCPNISLFCIFLSVYSPHSGCPGPWPCVRQSQLRSWWLHAAYPRCETSNTNIHTWSINPGVTVLNLMWLLRSVSSSEPMLLWGYIVFSTLRPSAWWIKIMWASDRNVLWNLANIPLTCQCHNILTYLEVCIDIDLTSKYATLSNCLLRCPSDKKM